MDISSLLLDWYYQNGRDLPWRSGRDPYRVWISEVIMQQTRMDQGLAYYRRFVGAFPDVYALAEASEGEVLRCWQGLGYYSRARNLHRAARRIVDDLGGALPSSSVQWLDLPGIGPYTAAAIASIAFNEPVPAIDANAARVISRLFAVEDHIDRAGGQKEILRQARALLPEQKAGDFNQAVMDFGSAVCKPVLPRCPACILRYHCQAHAAGDPADYPKRAKKQAIRLRYFHYFFFFLPAGDNNTVFFVRQRTRNDIWKHMYEFPLLETNNALDAEQVCVHSWWTDLWGSDLPVIFMGPVYETQHQLSHQKIIARFFRVKIDAATQKILKSQYLCVDACGFEQLAKPRLVERLYELANGSEITDTPSNTLSVNDPAATGTVQTTPGAIKRIKF